MTAQRHGTPTMTRSEGPAAPGEMGGASVARAFTTLSETSSTTAGTAAKTGVNTGTINVTAARRKHAGKAIHISGRQEHVCHDAGRRQRPKPGEHQRDSGHLRDHRPFEQARAGRQRAAHWLRSGSGWQSRPMPRSRASTRRGAHFRASTVPGSPPRATGGS